MVERIDNLKRHPLLWTLLLSLVLHLLFLWFFAPRREVLLFPGMDQLPVQPQERRVAFEIVETPKDTPEQMPDDPETRLRSDRNNRAADQGAPQDLPQGNTPYSLGNTRFNAVGNQSEGQAAAQNSPVQPRQASAPPRQAEPAATGQRSASRSRQSNFSRDFLVQAGGGGMPDARLNQQQSRARDTGGLTLNTYAWEYGPYLLELKRRIQKNIYPPPIFTRLGQGGSNALRFRIYPDGRMEGPEILDASGEKALVETSRKAVTLSAPFNALPKDFPEPYLEVTARFDYSIQ